MFSSWHSRKTGRAVWTCTASCSWSWKVWSTAACSHCIRTVGTSTEMARSSRPGWSWAWAASYCTHCYRRQEGELSVRSWTFCTCSRSSCAR